MKRFHVHVAVDDVARSLVTDPSGVRWETFFTFADATTYGEDQPEAPPATSSAPCAKTAPERAPAPGCC